MEHRSFRPIVVTVSTAAAVLLSAVATGQEIHSNEPGILEPVSSYLQGRDIRIPNTDQSVDGSEQSNIEGSAVISAATDATSLLGHPITQVTSPNDDMWTALQQMASAASNDDNPAMIASALELQSILLGTTEGRIYDGFGMLNFNRWQHPAIGPEHYPPDSVPGEYKMKVAQDTGETYTSPYDGEQRRIYEIDVAMLYYDGQIDSDTFLVMFPYGHHPDDVLHVNYKIYSLVQEDFSPTMVMLDRREAPDTVNFPFKGIDSVWIAMEAGEVLDVTVRYATVRQIRGVYTWGWRVHPPRIQFMQPVYEIEDVHTGDIILDPQSESFVVRNRDDLSLENIGTAAPEMKMYQVAQAILNGASTAQINAALTDRDLGPRGTWIEWADLVKNQMQLPPEAWEVLNKEEGLEQGDYGPYRMITAFLNNEMYGEGPYANEVETWVPGDTLQVKLLNLDNHTHYFRNVDFGARLHDDILRCCGGGFTSFEIMNFKPTYGAPKVAEMQWRAGWGFRPHHDVLQQQDVFARARDRLGLQPYTGGLGTLHFGYQYSAAARGGDFRFSPPPFIITDHDNPAPFPLKDKDGLDGLLIGQHTEGYGVAQMCPQDPFGDFCQTDFGPFNPHGALNWPSPNDPTVIKTELRFPPFLRNPDQNGAQAGDIIPPTSAWRPFLWQNPYNGSLYIDPADPDKGYWSDLTYSHGAPLVAGSTLTATVEAPRHSAQVFYQFDDLFHDNSIFSPHPLTDGNEGYEVDTLTVTRARLHPERGLSVLGRVSQFAPTSGYSPWVSLHEGPAGSNGCTGDRLRVTKVFPQGGFLVRTGAATLPVGATVCMQSILGGFDDAVVQ